MKKDYGSYSFSGKEKLRCLWEAGLLWAAAEELFYQDIRLFVLFPVFFALYFRKRQREKIKEQKQNLNRQFKDLLDSLSVLLQAGYSVENAVPGCAGELERLYGKTDLVRELYYIESQMKLSVPVEKLFLDLGRRSQVEDIESFAVVFQAAKRSGGDLKQILKKTAQMLGDKIEVKKEIEAALTAKKNEQFLMSLMPAGIIVYMRLTSPGFLEVLYGNLFGAAVMTVCLAIYGFAYWLGRRIVEIEV